MTNSDKDKIAIITGSARGIGLATAQKMKANGLRPVLVDYDADALAIVVRRSAVCKWFDAHHQ